MNIRELELVLEALELVETGGASWETRLARARRLVLGAAIRAVASQVPVAVDALPDRCLATGAALPVLRQGVSAGVASGRPPQNARRGGGEKTNR